MHSCTPSSDVPATLSSCFLNKRNTSGQENAFQISNIDMTVAYSYHKLLQLKKIDADRQIQSPSISATCLPTRPLSLPPSLPPSKARSLYVALTGLKLSESSICCLIKLHGMGNTTQQSRAHSEVGTQHPNWVAQTACNSNPGHLMPLASSGTHTYPHKTHMNKHDDK